MRRKKRMRIILGMVVLASIGIVGKGYLEHQEKEMFYLEKQRVLVKQIKRTYADVEKIEFEKGSIDTSGVGSSTMINATITTKNGESELVLRFPYHKEDENDSLSFAIGTGPEDGVTHNKVKVVYENGNKEWK